MPKYSFIIPVYNCEQYLEECVESVLAQTVSDFEILLIDDGSPDGSGALCDKLKARDKRIRVFHKENGGAGSARNTGIKNADSRYLLFVDGDDSVTPNLLETIDTHMEEGTLALFGMDFDYYSGGRIAITEHLSVMHSGVFSIEDIAASFADFFNDNALSSACNKVFDLDAIRANEVYYNESMDLFEDLAFVMNYMSCIRNVCCIGSSFYHYRLSTFENHLHGRVYDIDRLVKNMNLLLEAGEGFRSSVNNGASVGNVLADLYMQLFSLHLFLHHYSAGRIRETALPYVGNDAFQKYLSGGAQLCTSSENLLRRINDKRFISLSAKYKIERLYAVCRRTAKRILYGGRGR